jgi:hypothetical protein
MTIYTTRNTMVTNAGESSLHPVFILRVACVSWMEYGLWSIFRLDLYLASSVNRKEFFLNPGPVEFKFGPTKIWTRSSPTSYAMEYSKNLIRFDFYWTDLSNVIMLKPKAKIFFHIFRQSSLNEKMISSHLIRKILFLKIVWYHWYF